MSDFGNLEASLEEGQKPHTFLGAAAFVAMMVEKLDVELVQDLTPRQKSLVAFAFQMYQVDKDELVRIPDLELDDDQQARVAQSLAGRGGEMFSLVDLLVGYEEGHEFEEYQELLNEII